MSKRILTNIGFGEACSPAFVMGRLSLNNTHKSGAIKLMISAKFTNTGNCVLNAIRRSNNESFHTRGTSNLVGSTPLGTSFGPLISAQTCNPFLFSCFCSLRGSALLRFTHLALCFLTMLAAEIDESQLFDLFRSAFLPKTLLVTKLRRTHFGAGFCTAFRAFMGLAHIAPCFFCMLSAKLSGTNFLSRLWRALLTQVG